MNTEKKNKYQRFVPAIAFVLIALSVLALIMGYMSKVSDREQTSTTGQAMYVATAQEEDVARTITVTGSSELNVMADRVRFYITVTGEDATVSGAGEKTIASLDKLLEQLEVLGFEESNMQTSSISLNRSRRYVENNVYEDYYTGQFSIQATLPATTNNARLVNIFSTISQIEGAELTGMTFYANNPAEYEKEAYYAAVQDAYAKAEKILESTGEHAEIEVRHIAATSYASSPLRSNYVTMDSAGSNSYLPGANESIKASVTVEFEF